MNKYLLIWLMVGFFSGIYLSYTWGLFSKALEKLEPHRVYMGEDVRKTVSFWSNLLYMAIGGYVYSYTNSWIILVGVFIMLHILDFGFWLFDEKIMNTNPMKNRGGL